MKENSMADIVMADIAINNLAQRSKAAGPKKILACDGGGILGLMSVEILAKIEAELRGAFDRPQLVLADYFDFVCGTSTGAIIAACISAGMSVATIRDFYVSSGAQMFDKAALVKRLRYDYNSERWPTHCALYFRNAWVVTQRWAVPIYARY